MQPASLRTLAKIGWIPVLLVAVYSGWLLYSRHEQNRDVENAAKASRAQADRDVVQRLGGGQMKILTFYANPPVVKRGERALLCYGVASAKAVRIEPDAERITPSLSRCIEVRPAKETQYTLTAEDAQGRSLKQETVLKVE